MENEMVKGLTLLMREVGMKENGKMGNIMAKGHTLLLMETGLKENGRMGNHGTSQ